MSWQVGSGEYRAECPHKVDRVVMLNRWDRLTFLHWSYDAAVVQSLLPEGLVVEQFQGSAWVGLVPFFMELRLPGRWQSRWSLAFPETNVRTYVRGSGGESGVWFFSLDAARVAAVPTAWATYRVRYFWSEMTVTRNDDIMRYTTRRRWPGPRNARSTVVVEIGDSYLPEELTEFEHFLTARWTLYGTWGRRWVMARAEHLPWTLHRAQVRECEDELIRAVGLPAPMSDPVVHWSPGVDVKVGYPQRVK